MEKLITIQNELKAPKSQYNKFGNYPYRNAEDILEAVKPLLAKYKCLLFISDEIIYIEGRHYVKATATFIESDGWQISVSASAREEQDKKGMDGSQITGASSSYARKYALNGLFLIDDTKDSDSTNAHGKDEKPADPAAKPPVTTSAVNTNQVTAQSSTTAPKLPPTPIAFDAKVCETEIKAITTKADMGKYWGKNKALQGNPDFLKLITDYGNKLTK